MRRISEPRHQWGGARVADGCLARNRAADIPLWDRYRDRPRPRPGFLCWQDMVETEQDDAHLEMRRRRLRFRAWHRGTLEMDFVVGRFADAELDGMNGEEITQLEALMDLPDPDLFAWVVGQTEVPAQYDTPVFRRMVAFHRAGRARQIG